MGRKATTRQTPVDQHLDWHLDPGPRTTTHSPAPTPTPILTSTPSSTQSTFSRWLMGPICERQKKWICHQLGDLKISFDWLQFGDLRLNVTCYIYIYIHIFVKGGPVSVDDGFSPMLWTISCKWYSTHGIRKDLGVELGHMQGKSKVKDSCRVWCGFLFCACCQSPFSEWFWSKYKPSRKWVLNELWPGAVVDRRIGVWALLTI